MGADRAYEDAISGKNPTECQQVNARHGGEDVLTRKYDGSLHAFALMPSP
jgi:hypothetical protein